MKKSILFFLFIGIAISSFTSCLRDQCEENRVFNQYTPVFLNINTLRSEITTSNQRALTNPGKIYYYKQYLMINEQGKGIHIYDNSNPESPSYVIFYNIPGNFDLAVKDDVLYADNAIDLISINLESITNPTIVHRVENYLGRYINPNNPNIYAYSEITEVQQTLDCSNLNWNSEFYRDENGSLWSSTGTRFLNDAQSKADNGGSQSGGVTGIGGSTARFTIVNNYLYTVDRRNLHTYDISNKHVTAHASTTQVGWNIETIYPFKSYLYIGSATGMYAFSIKNPGQPYQLSSIQHVRACDPVVANDTYAYVTLRSGNRCQGTSNQLEIIDVSNVEIPKLIKIFPMSNPNGLSLVGDLLYISERDYGISVIDVKDPTNPKSIASYPAYKSSDVIYLGNNHLLSIGSDGFHQFDISDPKNIRLISTISK